MDGDGRLEADKSGSFHYALSPITDGKLPKCKEFGAKIATLTKA
jgi:hypothetical protein